MKPDIYPIEENRTNDATLERKLRAKINEWAAETPNHPFQNLGDLIEVRKITYCPSYVVELVSQYESRTKGKDTKPYINEKIPKRTFRELNEFNVWQFNYPELSQFTN
jgi:hypothetical protein